MSNTPSNAADGPRTRKGRATRERLLAAAREVAIRSGGEIELAAVAEEAGVVPGLVHHYFGSKAGLVGALVDDFFDRFQREVFEDALRDAPERKGDWARHERMRLEAGVRFHYGEPFAVVMYGPLARDPEVARREADRIAFIVDRAARSVRKAQRRGELPLGVDPAMAGAAMFGAMRQVMVEALTRARRPAAKRVVEFLWRQIAASVGIDPDASEENRP